MTCKKCGSNNVIVQYVQTSSKTKTKSVTKKRRKGCILGLLTLPFTFFKIFIPSSKKYRTKGKEGTTFQNDLLATCQNCGHSWKVKRR